MSEIVFPKKTLRDVALGGKTVLVRVDYNVPLGSNGAIMDDFRIESTVPTIKYLIEQGAKIVLCSHLGRPSGKRDEKLSLKPIAENLAKLLKKKVIFVDDCVGLKVRAAVAGLGSGDIALLENLRFYAGEENNDPNFARQIVTDTSASYFIQDGFGVVHRTSATTAAVTNLLPSVAGLLVENEWLTLETAVQSPKRPLITVMGGAKISDKIDLMNRFVDISDGMVVGGAMANTFLKYLGFDIGESLCEPDMDEVVKQILGRARNKFGTSFLDKFILPVDIAVSESGSERGKRIEMPLARDISNPTFKIYDIGSGSMARAQKLLSEATTVIWNGTLGVAEKSQWAAGSAAIAESISDIRIVSVIGGGDTASFARDWAAKNSAYFSHISTGGGASLELMAGESLAGIDSLLDE
ncbi:MAG: phosphoglycerate kinase [Candidatus Nomurabacteria bacterium]|jgi:phosphoglycerate kinase|nr:phosphoglycerate kinase [Candidatus Nomurabacteria bacterium]